MPSAVPRALMLLALAWVGVYWLLPGPWRPARSPQHLPDYSAEREPPPMTEGARGPTPALSATSPGQPSENSGPRLPGPAPEPEPVPEPEPGPVPGTDAAGERFHVVEPGDSLWKIALRYYGSGDRAAEIFEANRDVLKSPTSLKLGTRLRIPAR